MAPLTTDAKKAIALTALLLALTVVFLAPGLWPPAGQVLGEGDDMSGMFYLWMRTARDALRQGRLPLWDPDLFGGYPFIANPQVGLFYPPTWLVLLIPITTGIGWYVAFHVWLSGVGMLLLARSLGARWLGALLAALAYGFGGYVAARIWVGHTAPLSTTTWLPWMLLSLNWCVKRGSVRAAVIAGIPFSLALLGGHIASFVYVAMIWAAFALFLALTTRAPRVVLRQIAIITGVGLALGAIQLIPFLELMARSARASGANFEFATDFSMPPGHLLTLIVPEFFGEPIRAGYWSVPNFVELTYYVGVLPLLAIILAIRKPTRLAWFYMALIVLGLLLALGRYGFLYRFFYVLLPPFRVMRAPGRAAFLFVFGASALLAEAMTIWSGPASKEKSRAINRLMRWYLVIVAVAGVAALAATGASFAAQHPTDTSGRLWHQVGGWAIAVVLTLIGGGLVWAYLTARDERKKLALASGLVALMIVDLWTFGYKFIRLGSTEPDPLWVEAKEIIGETGQRVLPWGVSIFSQNDAGAVGLASVFGYNALEVASAHDLAASVPDPRSTAYDILGVEHVLAPLPQEQFAEGERPLDLVEARGPVWVYRRDRVLPLARLVYGYEVVTDEVALARVADPTFDPSDVVLLDRPPPCSVGPIPDLDGAARILERRPGFWSIETVSDAPALLVLSETAYPGWHVWVDGRKETPLLAYSAIRAVCVAAGEHIVEFLFQPLSLVAGAGITVLAMALVAAALAWPWARKRSRLNPRRD